MQIPPSGAPVSISNPRPSSQDKTTVLIVDNEVSIRKCIKAGFSSNNSFNVLEARGVSDAIRLLSDPNNKIDYVISDGFGDGFGGNLPDLLDGFSSSPNKSASLIIYTGGTTPEMDRAISKGNISCKVIEKSRVVPHKLVNEIVKMRNEAQEELVQNTSPPQTIPNASLVSLGGKKTILVVDDQKFTFEYLQDMLESFSEPFNLIYADSVAKAKEILARGETVDIVLSDGFVDGVGGTLSELLPAIKPEIKLFVNTASPRSVNVSELEQKKLDFRIIDKSMTNRELVGFLMKECGVASSDVSIPEPSVLLPRLNVKVPLDEVTEGVLNSDLGANQKILIVDDCPETTERLSGVLGRYFTSDRGNEIYTPNTAYEAARITREQGITLLCTDLYMETENGIREHPNLTNGDQLLKELGENCPSVVIVSGSWSDDQYANLVREKDRFVGEVTLEYRLQESTIGHRLANLVVPILGVSKTKVFYDEASLVRLCLSALSMGKDKQPDIMASFLKNFSPKMKENEKVENSSIVKIEEALLLAQAEFLQMKDRVNLNDFAVGREELGGILQGIEKEFSTALKITRKLYETDNKAIGLHDIVNKRAAIASYIGVLSGLFEQSGKNDLALMARECERLISDHAGNVVKDAKARIEALTEPQIFLLEDEIKTLISSEFSISANRVRFSSNSTFIHGLKTDYLDLVKQLIMNSTKAVKETVNPSITIDVSENPNSIEIIVSDNGCGMNQGQLRDIYERKSLPSSWGTGGEGMGFIYKTLEKLNADMEVSSSGEGMGATFKITIPKNTSTSMPQLHQQSQLALV